MLSIGLMSGTSMDGIEAALLETDGSVHLIKELGNESIAYAAEFKILLKAAEKAIRACQGSLELAQACYEQNLHAYLSQDLGLAPDNIDKTLENLHSYLKRHHHSLSLSAVIQHSTELHALVVNRLLKQTKRPAQSIDVIGYHGQTMLHRPAEKISVIVGHAQELADQLGITVVSDFRSRDVAAGGKGAPFAPLYHQALAVRDGRIPSVVVNCGGLANLTLIRNSKELDLIAFDTGPGNGLIDRLVRQRTQGKESMDKDGRYGKRGKINEAAFQALFEKSIILDGKNYFLTPPPKALDIADLQLVPELETLSLEDACATLEAFTAETIVSSLPLVCSTIPQQWILAGGGWNNPVIRQQLEERVKKMTGNRAEILLADQAGWNSQAMEAQIFAYLAVRSLQNQVLSVPGTTGVPEPMSGGQIFVPGSRVRKSAEALETF